MHKVAILEHEVRKSYNGTIGIRNTVIDTAVKLHNCPIRVTCTDFSNPVCDYTVEELIDPTRVTGPYPDQFVAGQDYFLHHFNWKVTPINNEEIPESPVVETTVTEITVPSKGIYNLRIPVQTVVYEDSEVDLITYVGTIIKNKRIELGLNQKQLSNLTEGSCSPATISKLEMGDTNASLNIVEALCTALGLHISDVIPPKNG